MRPAENIEKLIRDVPIDTSAETDRAVLVDTLNAFENLRKTRSAKPELYIRRIIMKKRITKLATAAAVIVVASVMSMVAVKKGDSRVPSTVPRAASSQSATAELLGPQIHNFDDGSVVKLGDGAKIRLYDSIGKRGFEHIVGEIEVTVAKAAGEFVVVTALGTVRALGTVFTMDLIDTVPRDSTERIEVLAVKVREGVVEVSNAAGSRIVRENQSVTVEKDKEPYDFRQDENLPERLVERIEAMLDAFEAGDKRAWLASFNIQAAYDLVKGNIEYSEHPDWFSGMSEDDARRIREGFADVNSPEEMAERALATVNIHKAEKVYVQSVTMAGDGEHATARCVRIRGERRYLVTTPQWTYFYDDWWQTDD